MMKKGIPYVSPFFCGCFLYPLQTAPETGAVFVHKKNFTHNHCHRDELIFFSAYYIRKRRKPHQNRIERDRISLSVAS